MRRQAEITLSLGGETRLKRFHARERLSSIFQIDCEVVVDIRANVQPYLGKPVLITVYELERPVRYFHARLVEAHYLRQTDEGFHFFLVLRPWIYMMQGGRAYRIFEQKRATEIIKSILSQYSGRVEYRLQQTYYPWPYCTQHNESDFDFMMRIMEKEGIYFFFDHEAGEEVLILADGPSAHRPSPRSEAATVKLRPDQVAGHGVAEAIWAWQEHVTGSGTKTVELKSYDYEKSSAPKATHTEKETLLDLEDNYEFLGDFIEPNLARHWAEMRIESIHANDLSYSGSGDMIGIACGGRFKLDSNDAFSHGQDFIVTALDYDMDAEPFRTDPIMKRRAISIEAITRDTRWRAPIVTPLPRAGAELAIVREGGADDPTADATGNVRGRVRVEFMWTQLDPKRTKAQSCWLRVSHPSAGAGFGHVTLPRTGEEVIVDFLNGNPDRPVVTGRVYNSDHRHAYALPTHRTRSLYRSRTIGRSGSYAGAETSPVGVGYNEFMFEDKGGAEEVYLRAQRNRRTEVFLDDDEKVRRDQTRRVGRDRSTAIKRNETVVVETGDRSIAVEDGSSSLTAAYHATQTVLGSVVDVNTLNVTISAGVPQVPFSNTIARKLDQKSEKLANNFKAADKLLGKISGGEIIVGPMGIIIQFLDTVIALDPAGIQLIGPTISLVAEAEINLTAPTVNITSPLLTATTPVIVAPPV